MNLRERSAALRKTILNLVYHSGGGHIGGDFSVCDILNVLYAKHLNVSPETQDNPERDRFILSKGHSVEALYSVLAMHGFFPSDELASYGKQGTKFIGHPSVKVPGIEINSGSLGHGLSMGAGMALAASMDSKSWRVYVVMGDGELAEGSVWEAAMLAGHYKLDQLIAIVDRNRLQISGSTENVLSHEPLNDRFASFGWHVLFADGNDVDDLDRVITEAKSIKGKPVVIIANTVKGKGVSFMENQAGWHHRVPTPEEYKLAMEELTVQEEEVARIG
jgi:transketolase